jgi:tRNA (guanine26-N2/guanine27-N2)-dimethyltransferase
VRNIFGKSEHCPECGSKIDFAGPLWIGSLSDPVFIEQVIDESHNTAFKNSAKITKLLTLIKNEATSPAAYYVIDKLTGKLKLPAPSVKAVLTCIKESGFQAVPTHFNTRGIKTNAPALIMQKIIKEIVVPK